MRVLVTGGSGFLGSEVAARAVSRHDEVFATHRVTPPSPAVAAQWVCVDLADAGAVERMMVALRPEVVIHTAYRTGGPRAHLDTVEAAGHVARAAVTVDAALLHVSSDVVFSGRDRVPLAEGHPTAPVSGYGRLKLRAEEEVLAAHPGAIIARTSLIYGGPDHRGPQERLVVTALEDPSSVTFHTDEIRCPVYVADLAWALLALVDGDARGIWHVAGPRAISRLELARGLARSLGGDPGVLRGGPTPEPPPGGPVRPRHLHLDSSRFEAGFGPILRDPAQVLGG